MIANINKQIKNIVEAIKASGNDKILVDELESLEKIKNHLMTQKESMEYKSLGERILTESSLDEMRTI